jgi:hypothetical protein
MWNPAALALRNNGQCVPLWLASPQRVQRQIPFRRPFWPFLDIVVVYTLQRAVFKNDNEQFQLFFPGFFLTLGILFRK